jgi:hypothetical protein
MSPLVLMGRTSMPSALSSLVAYARDSGGAHPAFHRADRCRNPARGLRSEEATQRRRMQRTTKRRLARQAHRRTSCSGGARGKKYENMLNKDKDNIYEYIAASSHENHRRTPQALLKDCTASNTVSGDAGQPRFPFLYDKVPSSDLNLRRPISPDSASNIKAYRAEAQQPTLSSCSTTIQVGS